MVPPRKGKLPRLGRRHYQGHAVVFWTNTLKERARGWLTPAFQATFRELMLHAAVREQLFCPAYCLMPDHLHLIWMGVRRQSDQWELFWKLYVNEREAEPPPPTVPPLSA